VSGDPYEQLDDMTASGPVQFIFEAEQATSLVDASGRDLEFFEKNNFGELFGTIQGAAITQFVLAITKLYERPSQRYPNLSLPSVISHIAANAARLEIKEERLARLGLDRLGVDSAPLARANAPEEMPTAATYCVHSRHCATSESPIRKPLTSPRLRRPLGAKPKRSFRSLARQLELLATHIYPPPSSTIRAATFRASMARELEARWDD
jgi:hypothetical protein